MARYGEVGIQLIQQLAALRFSWVDDRPASAGSRIGQQLGASKLMAAKARLFLDRYLADAGQ